MHQTYVIRIHIQVWRVIMRLDFSVSSTPAEIHGCIPQNPLMFSEKNDKRS